MEVELLVGTEQVALDCVDFGFAVGGDLQLDLPEGNDCMFGLDEFSVEILLFENAEENLDSEVGEFSCELHLVVSEAALGALEGADHEFPEEGDLGEHDVGGAVLLAVGAEAFDGVGCVRGAVPFSKSLISVKSGSSSSLFCFFCIVDED